MVLRVFRWALLLSTLSLLGCSTDNGEPSPREVRTNLEKAFAANPKPEDRLTLTDFQPDGEHRYKGTAKDVSSATYHLTITTKGRSLTFEAQPDRPGGNIRHGSAAPWPEPPFDERHPQFMQWLRGGLCGLHTVGVIWPMLGRFGWRRRYSPGTERVLSVFALVNVGFALFWGYMFMTNMTAA